MLPAAHTKTGVFMLVARTRPSHGGLGTVRLISYLALLLSILLGTAALPAASAAPGQPADHSTATPGMA